MINQPAKTTSEVLRAMAKRLQDYGWKQGDFGSADGPCCIRGAWIMLPPEFQSGPESAYRAIANYLGLRDASWTWEIMSWNDAPGRTAEEVIAALQGAADACEVGA